MHTDANTELLGHFIFWTMLSAKAEKLVNSFICGANFFIKKKVDHLYCTQGNRQIDYKGFTFKHPNKEPKLTSLSALFI